MAHSEFSKFYEAERPDIKLDHSDFAREDKFVDFNDNKDGLVEYLLLIEDKYKNLLATSNNKLSVRFCNEIFVDVLSHCANVSPVFVIDEICVFFDLDYQMFFKNLDTYAKNRLFKALKERVNCDTFLRIRRRETIESTGGCIQPTFNKKR